MIVSLREDSSVRRGKRNHIMQDPVPRVQASGLSPGEPLKEFKSREDVDVFATSSSVLGSGVFPLPSLV